MTKMNLWYIENENCMLDKSNWKTKTLCQKKSNEIYNYVHNSDNDISGWYMNTFR